MGINNRNSNILPLRIIVLLSDVAVPTTRRFDGYKRERELLHDDSIAVLEEGDHGEEAHEDLDGAEDERYGV